MLAAAGAITFLDAPRQLVNKIPRLIKPDFRFAAIRRRMRQGNVATVFSYDPQMGGLLARLDRSWALLYQPGFHDAALPQRIRTMAECRYRLDVRNVHLRRIHAYNPVARPPLAGVRGISVAVHHS